MDRRTRPAPPGRHDRNGRETLGGTVCDALRVVEIEQHGRTLRGGDEQVLELTECVRADGVFEIVREERAVLVLVLVDVEVVGPEIGEDFVQLVIGCNRAEDCQRLHLCHQRLQAFPVRLLLGLHLVEHLLAGHGIADRLRLRNARLVLLLHLFHLADGYVQHVERLFGRCERRIVNVGIGELDIDPFQHTLTSDGRVLTGRAAVGKPVKRMARGIEGGDGGLSRCRNGSQRQQAKRRERSEFAHASTTRAPSTG